MFVEGYEPNALRQMMLPMSGNRNGPSRRSSSVPIANPFWSQKTREEMELLAARPAGLPSTPLDELDGMDETSSERLPVRDARRGGRSRSQDRSGGSWRTPELQLPMSWADVKDYEMVFRDGYVRDFGKYQEVVEDMVHQKEKVKARELWAECHCHPEGQMDKYLKAWRRP